MAILHHIDQKQPGNPDYAFFCPACGCAHGVWLTHPNDKTQAMWTFNGDFDKPTFSPSLRVNDGQSICHVVVTDGRLHYCADSTHRYAGQVIDMLDF